MMKYDPPHLSTDIITNISFQSCDMFRDPSHPSWQDQKVNEELEAHLHTSKDACIANINLITGKLQVIEHESEEFDKVTKKGKEVRKHLTKMKPSYIADIQMASVNPLVIRHGVRGLARS